MEKSVRERFTASLFNDEMSEKDMGGCLACLVLFLAGKKQLQVGETITIYPSVEHGPEYTVVITKER